VRGITFLHEEKVGLPTWRCVGLAVEAGGDLRGREVAHPVGVGDGDDDHLRNHEGRVDPRAEDL
jgi:hypothetical protein